MFRKTAIAAALAVGFVAFGAQAANTTISNANITAVINDGGTFAGWFDAGGPAAGTPGLSYDGVEFVNIDNPSSWWTVSSSAGTIFSQYGSNPVSSTTSAVGGSGAAATTLAGDLSIRLDWTVVGDSVNTTLTLTNVTASAITDIKWGVGFDPDQGGSGLNTTVNTILGQGDVASVDAWYGDTVITLADTTSASPSAIAAYINPGNCCSVVSPATALGAAQAVGFTTTADDSISLAYDIGTLGALGSGTNTASIGWNYTMAVPEPETYAMLLAGLGLMGFVARRRKLKATA